VFVLLGGVAACGAKADVVARVNGVDITRAEFDRIYQQLITQAGVTVTDDAQKLQYQKALLSMLIESELVTQDAQKQGADLSDAAVDEQLKAMMGGQDQAAFEAQVKQAGLTMEDLRRSIKAEIARQRPARAGTAGRVSAEATAAPLAKDYALLEHILVSDETSAAVIYEQLKKGADFAKIANEQSIDTGSGQAGGSLGWASTDGYVVEFQQAADALKVGEISKPVKSQFGWHIIRKVNEAKAGTPLDKLPADLRAIVESDAGENALTAYIAELKAKADIEYVDETLKPE
jgi:parvulin-like peptidyl-prolyl isomerase